ncbi:MAG: ligase-associated DNA damage response exonuclease [Planctomycetota bacterium]
MTAGDRETLRTDATGLFCPAGGFHIDPWKPSPCAVITHAHADHARRGSARYVAHLHSVPILQHRLGTDAPIEGRGYDEPFEIGGVTVSLHPAGHVRGSAQVRVQSDTDVWVVSGDYKRETDPTCETFRPVACDVFITESTFGLPIYRWPDPEHVAREINDWWRTERDRGRTCVLYAYSLGKAQRLLARLDPSIGPIALHPAIDDITALYREQGVDLPPTTRFLQTTAKELRGGAMVLIPPSAEGAKALKALGPVSDGSASGWMTTRASRRWRSYDRGFVMSDHADWPGLLCTIRETGATRIGVTHGSVAPFVRYLRETGLDAFPLDTRYEGDG